MKQPTYITSILFVAIFLIACGKNPKKEIKKEVALNYDYSIQIKAADNTTSAPALQSFAHGQYNGEWLLFAGRTNAEEDNGGLHKQQSNYSVRSFPPSSFNTNVYCYNPATDALWQLSFIDLKNELSESAKNESNVELKGIKKDILKWFDLYAETFRSSNPQVTQDGEFLYVVGGYGTPIDSTLDSVAYQTFDVIARIHIPTMFKVVKKDWDNISNEEWLKWLNFGRNSTLTATGGELFKIGSKFYLAGGHDFKYYFNQRYLNCVYEFELDTKPLLGLTATITDTISDIDMATLFQDPKKADSTSKFRRRDGPIVSSLYADTNDSLTPGFSFYAGVFTYHFGAWQDAIHITPKAAEPYWIADTTQYNQKSFNVYACADFGIYDPSSKTIISYLPGGIGNGANDGNLSGFTNTLGIATFNHDTKEMTFNTSTSCFPSSYFGAEAIFFSSENAVNYTTSSGVESELIDASQTFKTNDEEVLLGYIYGGIESFVVSPGGYGSDKSGASNKVWEVYAKRTVAP